MNLLDPLAGLNTLQLLDIHVRRNFGPDKIIGGTGENIFDYKTIRIPITLKEKDDYLDRLNSVLPKIEPIDIIKYQKEDKVINLLKKYQTNYLD
jgi:hypothetical protein